MDGVPYLTQDPIQPGETFVYEFPLNHSGTYWYHAHMDSWKIMTLIIFVIIPMIRGDMPSIASKKWAAGTAKHYHRP